MAVDYIKIYGTDRDYRTGALLTNPRDVVAQQVHKRLSSSFYWDDRTLDLSDFLMDTIDTTKLQLFKVAIERLFVEDLRFFVSANVQYLQKELIIRLTVTLTSDTTPITMTYVVDGNKLKLERVS